MNMQVNALGKKGKLTGVTQYGLCNIKFDDGSKATIDADRIKDKAFRTLRLHELATYRNGVK